MSDTTSEEAYGTDCTSSTTIHARWSGPAFCGSAVYDTAQAETMRPAIMRVSSRAAASACSRPEVSRRLGVRKNGSLRVTSPFTTAVPMVWVSASPATAAAPWRKLAPTRTRYRWNSLAILNVNSDSGSTEYMTSGASTRPGAHTMAADQPSAARLNSRLTPSATHGSQPATKW